MPIIEKAPERIFRYLQEEKIFVAPIYPTKSIEMLISPEESYLPWSDMLKSAGEITVTIEADYRNYLEEISKNTNLFMTVFLPIQYRFPIHRKKRVMRKWRKIRGNWRRQLHEAFVGGCSMRKEGNHLLVDMSHSALVPVYLKGQRWHEPLEGNDIIETGKDLK